MTHKTAYLWGPISSFSGQLAAFLVQKGWHVHVATKSAFHFALSPLDLRSTAQENILNALGGSDKYKIFEERIKFLDVNEINKGTTYDAFVFCGLPPNFDEARVSRAPWAAENFSQIARKFKGVPVFIVSSLWGAVQNDGVVPEEIECERRKPKTQFEAVCQQYETKLLKTLGTDDTRWYLVRLPMMSGSTEDGQILNFSGPMTLFQRLAGTPAPPTRKGKTNALNLQFNPDATMWFLPVDVAVHYFWRLLEDEQRPRICNLVSTQATLNQEWLQHLARALGFSKTVQVDSDNFNLPGITRNILEDSILVKSRGLFEVMGRHQQVPDVLDQAYFNQVLAYARQRNWGMPADASKQAEPAEKPVATQQEVSAEAANTFFTDFLPDRLNNGSANEFNASDSIGFKIAEDENLHFVLKQENGQTVVRTVETNDPAPQVRFTFSSHGLHKLLQCKTSLERALIAREAKVEGGPLEILRACNLLKRSLKDHHHATGSGAEAEKETAGKTSK